MTYRAIRGALIGVFLGIVGALTFLLGSFAKKIYEANKPVKETAEVINAGQDKEEELTSSVIRFHVKANSDSEADIKLKYAVREEVLKLLGRELMHCNDIEESEEIINENLHLIEELSKSVVEKYGYFYDVKAYITVDEFPMRQYGELVLPAGHYKALRVDIGEAKGENFWCLLYPTVCFTVDSGAVLSSADGEEIRRELNEEEYDRLFVRKSVPRDKIKVRFKIFEFIKNIF